MKTTERQIDAMTAQIEKILSSALHEVQAVVVAEQAKGYEIGLNTHLQAIIDADIINNEADTIRSHVIAADSSTGIQPLKVAVEMFKHHLKDVVPENLDDDKFEDITHFYKTLGISPAEGDKLARKLHHVAGMIETSAKAAALNSMMPDNAEVMQ